MSDFETIKLASYYKKSDLLYRRFLNATVVKHRVLPELYETEMFLLKDSYSHITIMNESVFDMKAQMAQWSDYLRKNIEGSLTNLLKSMESSVAYLRSMYDKVFRMTKHRMFLTIFLYKVDYILAVAAGKERYINQFMDAGNAGVETQTCNYFFRNMLDDLESIVYALTDTYNVYARQYNATDATDDRVPVNWRREVRAHGSDYLRQLVGLKERTLEFKRSAYGLCGRMAQFQFLAPNLLAKLRTDMIDKGLTMRASIENTTNNLRTLLETLQTYEAEIGVIRGYVNQYSYSVTIRLTASNNSVYGIVGFLDRLLPNIQMLHERFQANDIPSKLTVLSSMEDVLSMSGGTHGLVEQFDEIFHRVINDCEQMSQALLILHDVLKGAFNSLKRKHRGGYKERFNHLAGNISFSTDYYDKMSRTLQHFSMSGEVFRNSVSNLMKRLDNFNSTLAVDETFVK